MTYGILQDIHQDQQEHLACNKNMSQLFQKYRFVCM